jgi:glutamine synthetase
VEERQYALDEQERGARAERGRAAAARLASAGVTAVAVTWVDNSGITRVKTVPVTRLERVAGWGVGMSPVFDTFLLDDAITTARFTTGPVGDLRLMPDLTRLTPLAGQPGWAWAPADRYTQRGEPHAQCARTFARRATDRLAAGGLSARVGIELEWVVDAGTGDDLVPVTTGPAYGMTRLVDVSDYARDLLAAMSAQGLDVDQFHPEYAPSQFELAVAATSPVAAADTSVLARQTIRAVSRRHGLRVSFAPAVEVGGVGNGGHVHVSILEGKRNLFTGGPGLFGLTPGAEAFTAGILAELRALLAVGAPCVASYGRLVPHQFAGAFACWGLENREAALRLVSGVSGSQSWAANLEVKCFDLTANPYLLIGSVLSAGLAGMRSGGTLPPPVEVDPADVPVGDWRERGIAPLPDNLGEAVEAFAASGVLREAFGEAHHDTFATVRRAEIEHYAGATPQEIVAAIRWRH